MNIQFNYNNGYQNWKNMITNVLVFNYIHDQIEKENEELKKQIIQIEKSSQRNQKIQKKYLQLTQQLFSNYNNITNRMEELLKNDKFIEDLFMKKNIDISYQSFMNWIKQGTRI